MKIEELENLEIKWDVSAVNAGSPNDLYNMISDRVSTCYVI